MDELLGIAWVNLLFPLEAREAHRVGLGFDGQESDRRTVVVGSYPHTHSAPCILAYIALEDGVLAGSQLFVVLIQYEELAFNFDVGHGCFGSRESNWRNRESGIRLAESGIGSRESDVKVICLQGLQDERYYDTQYQNGC